MFVFDSRFTFVFCLPLAGNGFNLCVAFSPDLVRSANIRIFYNIFRWDLSCDTSVRKEIKRTSNFVCLRLRTIKNCVETYIETAIECNNEKTYYSLHKNGEKAIKIVLEL